MNCVITCPFEHTQVGHWDNPEAQLIPELMECSGMVFLEKYQYSCFTDSTLAACLRNHNIRDVYLCGINTDYCVLATALDSFYKAREHSPPVNSGINHNINVHYSYVCLNAIYNREFIWCQFFLFWIFVEVLNPILKYVETPCLLMPVVAPAPRVEPGVLAAWTHVVSK